MDAGADGIDILNPYTKQVIGQVPNTSADDVQVSIATAKQAQQAWQKKSVMERANIMMKWHDLLDENKEDIAHIMTTEQGKPLMEARAEIVFFKSFIRWFAEESHRTYGDNIPSPTNDRRLITIKQPIGVCAAIMPWNFPAGMLARKVRPALASGCAMIVKPATETPFTAIAMVYSQLSII